MAVALLLDQPDLLAPVRARRARFGAPSAEQVAILNGRGRTFTGGGSSDGLSLKWMARGSADYESVRRYFRLRGSLQLLLNPGESYALRFREISESFTLTFSRALADRAWASVDPNATTLPEFPTLASYALQSLQKHLQFLREETQREELAGEVLIESSLAILTELTLVARDRRHRAERVPALRNATRHELLRRLARAEAYLIECGSNATIEGASRAAALSPFHLIRVFRAAHGETPLAYATRIRLEGARDALLLTADSIEEVARRAGYASRTAFDRAFKRHFTVTAGAVREGCRD